MRSSNLHKGVSLKKIMKDFFQYMQSAETEKAIEVRPELWKRLDRRMGPSRRHHQANWKRMIWMAACLLILLVAVFGLSIKSDGYQVEDLKTTSMPYFTKDDISGLERYYEVPQKLFVKQG